MSLDASAQGPHSPGRTPEPKGAGRVRQATPVRELPCSWPRKGSPGSRTSLSLSLRGYAQRHRLQLGPPTPPPCPGSSALRSAPEMAAQSGPRFGTRCLRTPCLAS